VVIDLRARDLEIASMIKFFSEQGKILMNNQRIITITSSAWGTLRRDLIETLGLERAKGFLLRYGWNLGISDAKKIKSMKWDSERELLHAGPRLHTINGHVLVEPLLTKYDFKNKKLHFEGSWKNSYEAEEHASLFGGSEEPVCFTLVGYASGYLTEVLGTTVIAKETACEAMGHEKCHWVCKTVEEWKGDLQQELKYYEVTNLSDELDQIYKRLKIERDNLEKTIKIHERLTQEVLYGHNLQVIANTVYKIVNLPILIEDHAFNPTAMAGCSREQAELYSKGLKHWIQVNQAAEKSNSLYKLNRLKKTTFIQVSYEHRRLITPINLGHSNMGYCSFLLQEQQYKDLDVMILEKVASACALYLFNEKTTFETEQRIGRNLLDEILSHGLSAKEITKRAHYIGITLSLPFKLVLVDKYSARKTIKEELEFDNQFILFILKFLKENGLNLLLGQKSGYIAILVPNQLLEEKSLSISGLIERLQNHCREKYTGYQFKWGISSEAESMKEAPSLFEEALAALRIADYQKNNIAHFESLGIVGILFKTGDLHAVRKFCYKILGKLIEYDEKKGTDFLKTLYFYLKNGCNLYRTASVMNLSTSGLRYRTKKISEIMEIDIDDVFAGYHFFLALQAMVLLGDLDIN
jgi:sugar diacid utilization regulator